MSWWNAKYKNDYGEYEITFGSKYYEKTKAVEKLCQAIIDQRVKSPDDLPPYISGKDTNVRTNADRIRAMSDEELAEFMCDNDNSWVTSMGRQLRYDNYLEWLQQPVKEDA